MSAERGNSKCEAGDCIEGDSSSSTRGVTIVTDTATQHSQLEAELSNSEEKDVTEMKGRADDMEEMSTTEAELSNSEENDVMKIKGRADNMEKIPKVEESIPELTNKLSLDDLLTLFSWLPFKDLITVKRVCHSWREAACHKCLWKDCVLKLFSSSEDEINIKLMPDVQYIVGWASNSVLNVILENIIELSKLYVEFMPPLSSSQVALVLDKYPKLVYYPSCCSA